MYDYSSDDIMDTADELEFPTLEFRYYQTPLMLFSIFKQT
ncbi:Hypothetical protein LOCK900_0041 [Lacticaseibacillus rhamnosus LOCK900]|nr:Hypothetical protein LOCK900_0041 [Lacticaseibacillus rhamnosus LOCK900]EHJ35884.1 hypothetical protein HMPREF0541_00231 [Lacticaseibacillus rhamnosus ATCC 21052]